MTGEKHFWHRLESLRGIFALTVAVHHSLAMIRAGSVANYLGEIFYGFGAVLAFFILSGLVLGNSLRRSGNGIFWPFYVRRVLRIYPALTAAILFSLVLLVVFHFEKSDSLVATPYYQKMFTDPVSLQLILNNLFLHDFSLDTVTWTILVELIGSFFLPFMHVASKKPIHWASVMIPLVALAVWLPFTAPSFLWVFYAGYLIPVWTGKVWDVLGQNRMLLAGLMAACLTVCWLTPHFANHPIPYALAMTFIVAVVYHLPKEPLFSFLDNAIVRFYGRISYSFYLLHFLVLYFLTGLVLKNVPTSFIASHVLVFTAVLAVVSIAVNTPLSWACYVWVEKPFVRLGQKWSETAKTQSPHDFDTVAKS